jgi:hypothetical protein
MFRLTNNEEEKGFLGDSTRLGDRTLAAFYCN